MYQVPPTWQTAAKPNKKCKTPNRAPANAKSMQFGQFPTSTNNISHLNRRLQMQREETTSVASLTKIKERST